MKQRAHKNPINRFELHPFGTNVFFYSIIILSRLNRLMTVQLQRLKLKQVLMKSYTLKIWNIFRFVVKTFLTMFFDDFWQTHILPKLYFELSQPQIRVFHHFLAVWIIYFFLKNVFHFQETSEDFDNEFREKTIQMYKILCEHRWRRTSEFIDECLNEWKRIASVALKSVKTRLFDEFLDEL